MKSYMFYLMLKLNMILGYRNHLKSPLILTFWSSFISQKRQKIQSSNFV